MSRMNSAALSRPALITSGYDVIVIGGGVNGVAIARECARAGVRALLLEQHDFASGTTSRSTRIIFSASIFRPRCGSTPARR